MRVHVGVSSYVGIVKMGVLMWPVPDRTPNSIDEVDQAESNKGPRGNVPTHRLKRFQLRSRDAEGNTNQPQYD